jgi:hypothetical protein
MSCELSWFSSQCQLNVVLILSIVFIYNGLSQAAFICLNLNRAMFICPH